MTIAPTHLALAMLGFANASTASAIAEPPTPIHQAQPENVELSWARSPEADICVSGSELKAAVRARLGRDPFLAPVQKHIEGYVARRGDQWIAELTVREHGLLVGKRHLESASADCRELDRAVSLTVTLIIDPNAALHVDTASEAVAATLKTKSQPNSKAAAPVAQASAASADTAAVNAPAPPASEVKATLAAEASTIQSPAATASPKSGTRAANVAVASKSTPPPTSRRVAASTSIATRLLLGPSFAYQLLPSLSTGLMLRSELALMRPFELGVAAAFYPEHRRRTLNTEVGYGLSAFELAGCYRPDRPVTLFVCASGWIGAAQSVVHVGTPDRPGTQLWGALRGDLGIAATSERLVAELRLFGSAPVTRLRYLDSERNEIFAQSAVIPGAEIGVGVRLP